MAIEDCTVHRGLRDWILGDVVKRGLCFLSDKVSLVVYLYQRELRDG